MESTFVLPCCWGEHELSGVRAEILKQRHHIEIPKVCQFFFVNGIFESAILQKFNTQQGVSDLSVKEWSAVSEGAKYKQRET